MKSLSFIVFAVLIAFPVFSQSVTQNETIKVWGNCGMCKKKIEKAAKSAGATTAAWSEETKELKVAFALNTNSAKIQAAIAKVGYDTQDVTADDAAYNNLPGCCQYDRKAGDKVEVKKCCADASCGKADGKKCCTDSSCCKSGAKNCCTGASCCKSEDKKCCADASCGKSEAACKTTGCCKEKQCCKS